MRLTFSTDYAFRLLMLVGLEIDRLVTIEEVADRFGISKNHMMKVAYQLGQAGYLCHVVTPSRAKTIIFDLLI